MATQPCPTCSGCGKVTAPQAMKAIRKAAGLTLEQFGARAGFSFQHISAIENGTRNPPGSVKDLYRALAQ